VEILRDVSIDWLGKKWYLIGVSSVLLLIGLAGYFFYGGFTYGVDFTGGTIIFLKFSNPPDIDAIRSSLSPEALGTTIIQRYGEPEDNSVQVRMQTVLESTAGADAEQRRTVRQLLAAAFDPQNAGRKEVDFNGIGVETLSNYLMDRDPDNLRTQNRTGQELEEHYKTLTRSLLNYRDRVGGGLVRSVDDLRNAEGVSGQAVESLKQGFFAGPFAVKGLESVGAVVGSDLRRRATLAVALSLLGMLVYIGFRFKPAYGVAAVVALFHDVFITLGLFAITKMEISLTVVAALLTLVGYSVNDTIVIFDRVRENLKSYRKESLREILNLSINQTLSRTIMTSGMTFIAVLALYLFGGEVLEGFSFALVIGIIIGTYSTLAIASPIVDAWYRRTVKQPKRKGA